jgi:hypothetical protein
MVEVVADRFVARENRDRSDLCVLATEAGAGVDADRGCLPAGVIVLGWSLLLLLLVRIEGVSNKRVRRRWAKEADAEAIERLPYSPDSVSADTCCCCC